MSILFYSISDFRRIWMFSSKFRVLFSIIMMTTSSLRIRIQNHRNLIQTTSTGSGNSIYLKDLLQIAPIKLVWSTPSYWEVWSIRWNWEFKWYVHKYTSVSLKLPRASRRWDKPLWKNYLALNQRQWSPSSTRMAKFSKWYWIRLGKYNRTWVTWRVM